MYYKIILLVSVIILTFLSFFFIISINSSEAYGYWKPINSDKYVRDVVSILPPELKKPEIITNTDQNNITSSYIKSVSENKIINSTKSEKELRLIADSLAEKLKSKIGSGDVELKEIEPPNEFRNYYAFFYNRKTIPFCLEEPSIAVKVRGDGSIYSFSTRFYPNLTAPTRPKLTDAEISAKLNLGTTVAGENMCIFPKWHPDGEYWTYHLAKWYDQYVMDTWSGEVLFEDIVAIYD